VLLRTAHPAALRAASEGAGGASEDLDEAEEARGKSMSIGFPICSVIEPAEPHQEGMNLYYGGPGGTARSAPRIFLWTFLSHGSTLPSHHSVR
jgi:hypothetical protein